MHEEDSAGPVSGEDSRRNEELNLLYDIQDKNRIQLRHQRRATRIEIEEKAVLKHKEIGLSLLTQELEEKSLRLERKVAFLEEQLRAAEEKGSAVVQANKELRASLTFIEKHSRQAQSQAEARQNYLQISLQVLQQENESLRQHLGSYFSHIQSLNSEIIKQNNQRQELQKMLAELAITHDRAVAENKGMLRSVERLRECQLQLGEQLKRTSGLEAERAELQKTIGGLVDKLKTVEAQYRQYEKDALLKFSNYESRLKREAESLSGKERQLRQTSEKYKALAQRQAKLMSEQEGFVARVSRLTKSEKEGELRLAAVAEEVKFHKKEKEESVQEVRALEDRARRLEAQIAELKRVLEEKDQLVYAAESRLKDMTSRNQLSFQEKEEELYGWREKYQQLEFQTQALRETCRTLQFRNQMLKSKDLEGEEVRGKLQNELVQANQTLLRLQLSEKAALKEAKALESSYSQLNDSLRFAKDQIAELKFSNRELKAKVIQLEEQLKDQSDRLESHYSLGARLEAKLGQLKVAQEAIATKDDELFALRIEAKQAGRSFQNCSLQLRRTQVQLNNVTAELNQNKDSSYQKFQKYQTLLSEAKRQHQQSSRERDLLSVKLGEVTRELTQLKSENTVLEKKMNYAERRPDALALRQRIEFEKKVEALEQQLEQRGAGLKKAEEELQQQRDKSVSKSKETSMWQMKHTEAIHKQEKVALQLITVTEQRNQLQFQLKAVSEQLDRTRRQVEDCEARLIQFNDLEAGFRSQRREKQLLLAHIEELKAELASRELRSNRNAEEQSGKLLVVLSKLTRQFPKRVDFDNAVSSLSREVDRLLERANETGRWQSKVRELEQELLAREKRVAEQRAQLEASRTKYKELYSVASKTEEDLHMASQEKQALLSRVEMTQRQGESEIRQLKQNYYRVEKQKAECEMRITQLTVELEKLLPAKTKQARQLKTCELALADLRFQHEEASSRLQFLKAENAKLRLSLEECQRSLREVQQQKEGVAENLSRSGDEVRRLNARVENWQEQFRVLEQTSAQTIRKQAAARQHYCSFVKELCELFSLRENSVIDEACLKEAAVRVLETKAGLADRCQRLESQLQETNKLKELISESLEGKIKKLEEDRANRNMVYENEVNRLAARINELYQQSMGHKAALGAAQAELQQSILTLKQTQDKLRRTNLQCHELQDTCSKQLEELRKGEGQVLDLQTELKQVSLLNQSLEGRLNSVSEQYRKRQLSWQSELQGQKQVQLQVEKELAECKQQKRSLQSHLSNQADRELRQEIAASHFQRMQTRQYRRQETSKQQSEQLLQCYEQIEELKEHEKVLIQELGKMLAREEERQRNRREVEQFVRSTNDRHLSLAPQPTSSRKRSKYLQ